MEGGVRLTKFGYAFSNMTIVMVVSKLHSTFKSYQEDERIEHRAFSSFFVSFTGCI